MSQSALSSLPFLFDRPSEPLFIGRDEYNFDIPTDYWPDRYKAIQPAIQTRFPSTGQVIPVQNVTIPDISDALSLGRHDNFSIFNPFHRSCAVRIIEVLMGMPNVDQFLSACVYCRERVNPYVFVYAASVAILHRPDTRNVPLPAHVEIFPELYMDGGVITRAREEVGVIPSGSRMPIEVPRDYTASDLDPEHRVAYFREDTGINLHHWHWHLVYPFDGPINIVRKDRRGELFYYMHQQIIARYNFERYSNGLGRVRKFSNWREPIPEGYYPKLDSVVASRTYPARQPNSVLSDLNRANDQIIVDVQDLERWRDRILNAIGDGFVNDGTRDVPLTETEGIDILGNIMEASLLSVNPNRYGDVHNMAHFMLACIHDPDNRFLESFGVMGDPTTAMRDPAFYTLHAAMDDIFQEHKATLTPYTTQQLSFDGIRVSGVEIVTEGARANEFNTFWQQNDLDLSRGLDFTPRGSVFARLTHLQHAPFTYRIRVENSGSQRVGTVRIFMAPRVNESGSSFNYRDQRTLFVELDRFSTNIRSGSNTIERRSVESNVTIPYEQTFRNLTVNRPTGGDSAEGFNYCGCGWPQHMLIAKGNAEGFPCELFVMISDGRNDNVQQTSSNAGNAGCDDAQSYCGLRGGLYPDRRAMGFPFDRNPRSGVNTLAQFLTSNMFVLNTTIRFNNRIVAALPAQGQRGQGQQGQGNRPTQTTGQGTGTQGQSGQGNSGTRPSTQPTQKPGTGGRPQRPSKGWYLPTQPDYGNDHDYDYDYNYYGNPY